MSKPTTPTTPTTPALINLSDFGTVPISKVLHDLVSLSRLIPECVGSFMKAPPWDSHAPHTEGDILETTTSLGAAALHIAHVEGGITISVRWQQGDRHRMDGLRLTNSRILNREEWEAAIAERLRLMVPHIAKRVADTYGLAVPDVPDVPDFPTE